MAFFVCGPNLSAAGATIVINIGDPAHRVDLGLCEPDWPSLKFDPSASRTCCGSGREWSGWIVALVFALGSAAAAGAGYAWVTELHAAERAALRSQVESAEFVQHRMAAMTPAERRQLDRLMRLKTVPKR